MTLLRSLATLLACLWLATAAAAPPAKPPVPDFTAGEKAGEGRDWTLGPTGARGWVYAWRGHTRDSRQILVTAVAEGSPADGQLEVGDVILESWTQTVWQPQNVAALLADAREDALGQLRALVLMRVRFGDPVLTPSDDEPLRPGDLLLLAGCHRSRRVMKRGSAAR